VNGKLKLNFFVKKINQLDGQWMFSRMAIQSMPYSKIKKVIKHVKDREAHKKETFVTKRPNK
jgi:hypothetical protein